MNLIVILAFLSLQSISDKEPTPKTRHIDSLEKISRTFWYSNRDSAIYYLIETLRLSKEVNYLKGEANALKGLGFLSRSNAEKLQYYIRALEIRQGIKDSIGIGASLLDIGTVYGNINEPEKQADYFSRSFEIRKKINDYGGIAICLINFGKMDEEKNNFSDALKKYKEALHYRLLAGELNGIAYAHINIAQANLFLTQYDSAIYYSNLAQAEFIRANNKDQLQWTTWVRSKCYLARGLSNKALEELKSLENSAGKLWLQNTQLMAITYEAKADFKQAFAYQKNWVQQNDELLREANDKPALELAADYEYKIQQHEIKQKEEQQRLQKQRQDNLQFLVIAIVLIGAFVFIAFLRKKISAQALNISVFVGFMFLFEFLVVLVEPSLQTFSGSKPVFILLGNTLIALVIAPLHHVAEKYFKALVKQVPSQ